MAARVCRTCRLSYANSTDFNPCPICDSETEYVPSAEPDEDIDIAVRAALHVKPGMRKLLMWRRKEFVRLGFNGAMLDLLVESPVDFHDVAGLVARGCPPGVAAEILL